MEIFDYYFELPSEIPALNITSLFFIVFVLISSLLLSINNKYFRNVVILTTSVFFIWTFSKNYYFLIISLIFCAYGYVASFIVNSFKNKFIYLITVLIPVIALLYFKNILNFSHNIIIPLGISFYVLRLIWYLKQVYNNEIEITVNPLYVFNYLIYFPCFSAGPIEKPEHFIYQLKQKGYFNFLNIKEGWFRFLYGIFEKIVICDYIGIIVNRILPVQDVKGITVFVGIILYSFQIYLDFDSYSNIAIGVSKIFGIDIEENFKIPYLSCNIKEFWSRWHISLSTWLKENIYIPLGGNKKGKVKQIINIFIVFIVSGLWHGSSLNFIIWGLCHALVRVIEDYIEKFIFKKVNIDFVLIKIVRIIINFTVVSFLWIIFRCDSISEAVSIISRMCNSNIPVFSNIEITINELYWLIIVIVFVVVVDILRYFVNIFKVVSKSLFVFRYALYIVGIVVFLIFGVYGGNFENVDFIYRWF